MGGVMVRTAGAKLVEVVLGRHQRGSTSWFQPRLGNFEGVAHLRELWPSKPSLGTLEVDSRVQEN